MPVNPNPHQFARRSQGLIDKANQVNSRRKQTNVPIACAIVFTPMAIYGLALLFWGFNGFNELFDGPDSDLGLSLLFHMGPIVWLMFSPMFVIPGSLRRPDTPVREYFTDDLAMRYSPEDVAMATGAHNSRKFQVRDIDENVIATGVSGTLPLPCTTEITIGDDRYDAVHEHELDPSSNFLTAGARDSNYALRVYNAQDDQRKLLMQYLMTAEYAEPKLITFEGASDMWLVPNPPAFFPNRYDMVIDDEVVGQVIAPGKYFFAGVMVVSNHFPSNVRALIAALCYQMMRG
ncbi:MAG: hypothetical protein KDB00_14025 [Planctomycetales bacterium]|nr:hypothetical protein [Planctomycetales bacterium]